MAIALAANPAFAASSQPTDALVSAQDRPLVGIGGATLPDALADNDAQRLQLALEEGLERAGFLVVGGAQAEHSVVLAVTRDRSDYSVVIQIVQTDGAVVAAAEETCELCGIAELTETVRAVTGRLRQRLELAGDGATLDFSTDPPGASVSIDDEIVGTTPMRTKVSPGPHTITVEKRGYRIEQRTIEARAGVTDRFSVTLDKQLYRRWVPWTALGAGVATIGVGAALLAIHDQPARGDCNADIEGNCQFLNNTRAGGAVTVVLGGALVVAGAVLAITWRDDTRKSSQRASVRPYGLGIRF